MAPDFFGEAGHAGLGERDEKVADLDGPAGEDVAVDLLVQAVEDYGGVEVELVEQDERQQPVDTVQIDPSRVSATVGVKKAPSAMSMFLSMRSS